MVYKVETEHNGVRCVVFHANQTEANFDAKIVIKSGGTAIVERAKTPRGTHETVDLLNRWGATCSK
jgi:hypothetical protein